MREWEVKVVLPKEVSIEELTKELMRLGYKLIESRSEVDTYIDLTPCKCVPKDTVLRVRKALVGNELIGELTYKGPKLLKEIKVREEVSTELRNPDVVVEIFRKLGFKTYVVRKERVVLKGDLGKVYLDNVEGLGKFMEFEVMNAKSATEFKNALRELLRKLGMDNYRVTSKSYLEMLLAGDGA